MEGGGRTLQPRPPWSKRGWWLNRPEEEEEEGRRQEIRRLLIASSNWDGKVSVLQVTSAVDSPTAWNFRCEIREKLIAFLQQRFPQSLPRVRLEAEQLPATPPTARD